MAEPEPRSWSAQTAELREDLQQQLLEIRQEVTRCARLLQEPAAIPADEVHDIRRQLEALGDEAPKLLPIISNSIQCLLMHFVNKQVGFQEVRSRCWTLAFGKERLCRVGVSILYNQKKYSPQLEPYF